MRNPKYELFGRMQREYHRRHPWRLNEAGLYVPHSYSDKKPDDLSWWDDVGFILNGRRVIVWWQHPRLAYSEAIDEQSWQEVGPGPQDDWLAVSGATKNFKRLGASRKKVVSYTMRAPSDEQQLHYARLRESRERLTAEGIEFEIASSWRLERLTWAMGLSLVAPLEVRSEAELAQVAQLARRLMLRQTALDQEFPDYRYSRADWVRELPKMQRGSA